MAEKKNELAVTADKFDLQTITGDFAEAIAEEMDGLGQIPYDRVKIPSGGGLAFMGPGEEFSTYPKRGAGVDTNAGVDLTAA